MTKKEMNSIAAKNLSTEQSTPDFLENLFDLVKKPSVPDITGMDEISSTKNRVGGGGILLQVILGIQFFFQALGLSFAIVNAVYLSTIDKDCPGYNKEESQFLFAVSIMFSIFFGIGTLTTVSLFVHSL